MLFFWLGIYPLILFFLIFCILSLKKPKSFRAKGLTSEDHNRLDKNSYVGIIILAPVFCFFTLFGHVPQNIYKFGYDLIHMENDGSSEHDTSECDPLYGC